MTYDYDLFVIGAGSGGLASSKRAASYGAKVAIAENDLVGGTCVIRGCVPKKLMVCLNIPRAISHENVPSAVFSQPEAGTVGLNEVQARAKFPDSIKCYSALFRPMFHALTGADEKTFVKLIVETNTDRVLGVHMVGKDAGEIIQGMAIAVNMGATKKDFDATIGIHPSTAEEFVTLG
jgi:pyruvate/2-oxoglutarate dehydrogenase complex dihydrolipoamide dehydrogenase (E3) component